MSLNLGAAELGESLTGDKGHTWLLDEGRTKRSQGSCQIAMVTAVESSLPWPPCPESVHNSYCKAKTGEGAELRQVSRYSDRQLHCW